MAGLAYLIPTARYKRAVKTGLQLAFIPEDGVVDPGRITEIYWSSDAGGYNRVVSTDTLIDFYLQVRTKDIYTSITVSVNTLLDPEEVVTGTIDSAFAVPIATDPNTGIGAGVVKYNIDEDEEMSFRNSRWISYPRTDRTHGVTYTNDSGKTIMISVTTYKNSDIYVDDVMVARQSDDNNVQFTALVAPGSTYRVTNAVNFWAEFR